MLNYYYKDSIEIFCKENKEKIIGSITSSNQFNSTLYQNKSWIDQIEILKKALANFQGTLFFEFSIPRMGKRVDAIAIIEDLIFVIEFKVGQKSYNNIDVDQVWDYALDLKNFHKPSHKAIIVPILVATEAPDSIIRLSLTSHNDNLTQPLTVNSSGLSLAIKNSLLFFNTKTDIDGEQFEKGAYSPTPTIIEAAVSLYNNHSVSEITRSDADATNLTKTTSAISSLIDYAKRKSKKVICFVTGVPGAGKTLVGLKVATSHLDKEKHTQSVYLSGNAPLVAILQEALARDKVKRELSRGKKIRKAEAKQAVKSFIQIIHHYRDAYLVSSDPPYDHVAIFDEAQRVWNKEQTIKFMRQKKNRPDFQESEPEFFISCLDRHKDWAVIVCLVGGGQEINTGESGISEWLEAVNSKFEKWEIYISPNLTDSEYEATKSIQGLETTSRIHFDEDLHLSVSMRSFRAEKVSHLVKSILDLNVQQAKETLFQVSENYPIVLTRDLAKAKSWLKEKARGTERYGLIVSSQAQRLKPFAIDVKSPINPVNWFLDEKDDVRSSYYLEDVATEFQVQGLELDWACVTWDGDLRYSPSSWKTFGFRGNKWQNIINVERRKYLINAYRVLLTRARQGMVIVIPEGDTHDQTRRSEYYDPTYSYLQRIGFKEI